MLSELKLLLQFVKACWRFYRSGCSICDKHVHDHRINQCNYCPALDGRRCSMCGCFVALKSWCLSERCPIGHWNY